MPVNEVAVFWDYGSCPVPEELTGYSVVNNIRSLALRFGNINSFKAYLCVSDHASSLPGPTSTMLLRSQLQCSGVSLTDVPGAKDLADKMLIVDMLAYAFDRSPESTVVILVSADPSLVYAMSTLRLRNHNVVSITPFDAARPDLRVQASLCFDWNAEIAREGEESGGVSGSSTVKTSPAALAPSRQASLDSTSKGEKSPLTFGLIPKAPFPFKAKVSIDRTPIVETLEAMGIVEEDIAEIVKSIGVLPPNCRAQVEGVFMEEYTAAQTGASAQRTETPGAPSSSSVSSSPDASNWDSHHGTPSYISSSSRSLPTPPSPSPPQVEKTLQQLKKKAPFAFRPLVEILHSLREEGQAKPLRSNVGVLLMKKDPQVYAKAGHARFAQYAAMAVTLGIAELGGKDGKAWIGFHPSFI